MKHLEFMNIVESGCIWDGITPLKGKFITIDTETNMASFLTRDFKVSVFQAFDGEVPLLVRLEDISKFLDLHKDKTFIMQNASFDIFAIADSGYCNMSYFHEKVDKDQVYDTKIMFQLLKLAKNGDVKGESSLKHLVKIIFGVDIDKNESVRCNFGQFAGVRYEDIPSKFMNYAMLDVYWTHKVFLKLYKLIKNFDNDLTHNTQLKASIVFRDMNTRGIGFDISRKDDLLEDLNGQSDVLKNRLAVWGYIPGRPGATKHLGNILKTLHIFYKLPFSDGWYKFADPDKPRKGDKGRKSLPEGAIHDVKYRKTSKEVLEDYMEVGFVSDYIEFKAIEKLLSFIKEIDTDTLKPQYNYLVNTGRSSCRAGEKGEGLNFQQLPKGDLIKSCFIPKRGKFVEIDYSSIEMSTLAHTLNIIFGHSNMSDAINSGQDLHKVTAASMFDKKVDEVTKKERQGAKPANFGLPANMGIPTFIKYAKNYGLKWTEDYAEWIKDKWKATFPIIEKYHNLPKQYKSGKVFVEKFGKEVDVFKHTTFTGRVRNNCFYSAWLNHHFQGLAADGIKDAMWEVWKKGYIIVGMVHDSLVLDCFETEAEKTLEEVSNIMIDSMRKYCTTVRVSTAGQIKNNYAEDPEEIKFAKGGWYDEGSTGPEEYKELL